jgi:hypothetical protein
MKTKLERIGLCCLFILIMSGWNMINAQAFVNQYANETYDVSQTISAPCGGELVDFSGDIHSSGIYIVGPNITMWGENIHHNYMGISGVGQTSGDSYHLVGGWHSVFNWVQSTSAYSHNKRVHVIHNGGANFYIWLHYHVNINSTGLVTSWYHFSNPECE